MKVRKFAGILLALAVALGSLCAGKVQAYASMADVAEDITIGDVLRGTTASEHHWFYYRFTLESRQRIVIQSTMPNADCTVSDQITLYDAFGNAKSKIEWDTYNYSNYCYYNRVENTYYMSIPLTLEKGTYYIEIYHEIDPVDFAYTTEYVPSTKYPSMELTVAMKAGDTLKLGTVISPASAAKKMKWSTSDKKIAAVSAKGVVKAKANGQAVITAKCNGSMITVRVNIK